MSTTAPSGASLAAHALSIRAGARELVKDLTATFSPREFIAILGRNGSGKTLTLHTLAGLRAAAAGSITLDGAPLVTVPRRKIARRIGVLLQDLEESFT